MMITRLIGAALLASVPGFAGAQDYVLGNIVVDRPVAAETPASATATVGAAYLIIANTGNTDETLVNVTADFPRVMMHQTVVENEIATMNQMKTVTIPAGETVTFEPGGLHIMFMGLNGDPFRVGEQIPATLIFEQAGNLDVIFNVEALDHQH